MEGENGVAVFPAGLLDWAGHRAGGVRKLFYCYSGRPTGTVIRTHLLDRLSAWASGVASMEGTSPQAVLLVGGPGNGKTEAIEFAIRELDRAYGLSGALVQTVEARFQPQMGQPPIRLSRVDLAEFSGKKWVGTLSIIQDASVSDGDRPESPAMLLVEDLALLLEREGGHVYLACVNRGVLDDALILATEGGNDCVRRLLESIVRTVGLNPDAPSCWPLADFPLFAVWPMDIATLLEDSGSSETPASQLLGIATARTSWPAPNACAAGERCPFCTSMEHLSGEPHRSSLLRVLRWYELASGKRWSFRDLFSLVSFLLAGVPPNDAAVSYHPCEWAARLWQLSNKPVGKPDSLRLSGPFLLVAAQYQHALFGRWPRIGVRQLRADLKELNLLDDPTLMGFYYFLANTNRRSVPETMESQLVGLADLLDPAAADPDLEVPVSARTTIRFRDVDTRFSQSVGEGRQYIQKFQCLSTLEIDLLKRLDEADSRLSNEEVSRRKPATAARVKGLIRDFACRLVRRSIGVRAGAVRDAVVLEDYQKVIRGDPELLHDAVKQVEMLINEKEHFVVTLNSTFGEPLPASLRRATLTTMKQKVKPLDVAESDRPRAPVRFLSVGGARNGQAIPLTYDLFKSVRELRKGMIPASLPRPVVALLDTTRARLSGQIVRDEESLDGSEIRIGLRKEIIVRELGKFLVRQEDAE